MLRRNGLPSSPKRKGLTWREFLSRHAAVFLCADMFQKEVWTFGGLTTVYVFFIMHLQTRKVLLARAAFSPTIQLLRLRPWLLYFYFWFPNQSGLSQVQKFFLSASCI